MPRAVSTDWIPVFRHQVRASTTTGWTVTPSRGHVRLEVRDQLQMGKQGVTLPYVWAPSGCADALLRIRAIYAFYAHGNCTLTGAAQMAAASSSRQVVNWGTALTAFKRQRLAVEGRTSEATWRAKYAPALDAAVTVLQGQRPPTTAADLCDSVLLRWEAGSRQRQIMRQNLHAFLRYCVERQRFKSCWLPPPLAKESRKVKRIGYPLNDMQILRLLDGLPADEAGARWRFAVQLMAVYGLRPEELRHLLVKDGADGPELWCSYRKSTGGGERTRPRQLHPLLVRDVNGAPQEWDLRGRMQIGEQLPPLGRDGKGGEAVGTYLRRKGAWTQLRAEAEAQGEELTPYSLRHRFAREAHAARLPVATIATAMGHTVAVHLQSYARFQPDGVADAFAAANAQVLTSGC